MNQFSSSKSNGLRFQVSFVSSYGNWL